MASREFDIFKDIGIAHQRALCSPYDWEQYVRVLTFSVPKIIVAEREKYPIVVVGGRAADKHISKPTGSVDWDVVVAEENVPALAGAMISEIKSVSSDIAVKSEKATDDGRSVLQIFMETCMIFDVIDIFSRKAADVVALDNDGVEKDGIMYAPISELAETIKINAIRHRQRAAESEVEYLEMKETFARKEREIADRKAETDAAEETVRDEIEALPEDLRSAVESAFEDYVMSVPTYSVNDVRNAASAALLEQAAALRDLRRKAVNAENRLKRMIK